ncbi:MAG: hypothetical protein ABIT37_10285 [Luteolibacter sp.]
MNLKSSLTFLSCGTLLTGWVSADVPRKVSISAYSKLWTNSIFTSPRAVEKSQPGPQLSDEYALVGVSPISGGYRVTLVNKKSPELRTTIDSDVPNSGCKILAVSRNSGDLHGTTVTLSVSGVTGTLGFDEAFLAHVNPPVKATPPPQAGQTQHSVRPRVVAPTKQ